MNVENIRIIENCFSNKPVDLSNARRSTDKEYGEFLSLLNEYRMQGHVELHAYLHNSGYFMDKLEAETGCPF